MPFPDDTPRCGVQREWMDDPCRQVAGWGTDHRGTGPCKHHDYDRGSAPIGTRGRRVDEREQRLRTVEAEYDAALDFLRQHPDDVHPFVSLLRARARTLRNIEMLEAKVEYVRRTEGDEALLTHNRRDVAGWVKWMNAERDRLSALDIELTKLGIAERHVAIAESQVNDMVAVIRASVAELGLSPTQQTQASVIMRRLFGELAAARRAALPVASQEAS